jgi:hypothetical protein
MTIIEPLPAGGYGKADWVDYSNYWREIDAEWIMERAVLRFATTASRQTQYPNPKFGMTTYNEASDRLEAFSKTQNTWVQIPQWVNLVSLQDTAAGVAISHKNAGGKGITFQPTQTVLDNPILVMGGVLTVDGTGVSIKTGARAAKLTTDAANLVSDIPISAAGFVTTGTVSAGSISMSGTLTAPNITMSGTLTGGVINGTSGTIGGVAHSGNKATASAGFDSQSGSFYGDSGSAIMRHVNRTGPYVQTTTGGINIGGGGVLDILANTQARIFTNPIQYIRYDGAHTGYFAPHFWGDPGVGNCPEGSIMIQ